MSSVPFVHLHVHSEFSLLDGACKIGALADLAKAHAMPALALTDHGNLFGVVQFYSTLKAAGIKPVIGYEAYVAPSSRRDRQSSGTIKDAAYHLTLLAESTEGYHNLVHLASQAYLEGFYYRPRIDKELLAERKEGIIALSGCASSEVCRKLVTGNYEGAERAAAEYRDILGPDHFFIEVQDNGLAEQRQCHEGQSQLAKRLGLQMVATNDIHYPRADDADIHEILLCINTGKTLQDESRMRMGSREFYFKSPDEMAQRFKDFPGAIANTVAIADRCRVEFDFSKRNFPRFAPPDGLTAAEYLRRLCEDGMQRRYGTDAKEVRERLDYELGVIDKMGYSSYFLIVWDLIHQARKLGVPSGLRGSGASAVVCYVLGISDIDPLRYKLIFERFLDPQRREPPDLDIDLCEDGREAVVDYVRRRYGEHSTAQIITFGTMAARGVLRDVGRALGWPVAEVDAITKRMPGDPKIKLKDALEQSPELGNEYRSNPRTRQLVDYGQKLEGFARHASTHAAGVVIADRPLVEFIPICKLNDVVMSQFAMGDLEKSGMLKLDLLGLRTLTIVNRTLDLVEARTGVRPDLDVVPLDDAKTYDLMACGDTHSVFQLGSSGMQELLRRLRPQTIEDIVAVVAMYRPGPLQSGMVDDFIARKHGEKEVTYPDARLEPILRDTYGVIVYQEQIMRILNELGGLTLADALSTIKAISKKKSAEIEKRATAFQEGAQRAGISKSVAEALFELIRHFAEYGFNRAHATAYAFLAYRTAYLKANYPMEYAAAGLTCEMGHSDKLKEHIRDVRRRTGIRILPPCVNEGEAHFTVCPDHAIRFGMVGVRNVGAKAVESLVRARAEGGPFKSLYDFCERVDAGTVSRPAVESLIKAGAFDCVPGARAAKLAALEDALRMGQRAQEDRRRGQGRLFEVGGGPQKPVERSLPSIKEWSPAELSRHEKEALGLRLSFNPLDRYAGLIEQLTTANAATLADVKDGEPVLVAGEVIAVRPMMAKNGRSMAHIEIEDLHGAIRAVVFSDPWQEYGALLKEEATVFVVGLVDRANDKLSLRVHRVIPLSEARGRLIAQVNLMLDRAELTAAMLDRLHTVCGRHPGECPLWIEIRMPDRSRVTIRAGRDLAVQPSDAFERDVAEVIGEGHTQFVARRFTAQDLNNGRRAAYASARN